jgi:tetratricopeptide (TPR) repeat protein
VSCRRALNCLARLAIAASWAPRLTCAVWACSAVAAAPSPDRPDDVRGDVSPLKAAASESASQARLAATARMWAAKHRDDLAAQAIEKALLIAPDDPDLLAQAVRIQLRLGDARKAQALLARLKVVAPGDVTTLQTEDEFRALTNGREELAAIRLLARTGRAQEAAQRLLAMFPHGAPRGALGAEYYRIVAGVPEKRVTALDELRRRTQQDPSDTEAALALADLLNQRSQTRREANRIVWSLALRDDTDRTVVMNHWRRVLQAAGADPAYAESFRAYLRMAPGDSEFEQKLAENNAAIEARKELERDPGYIAQQQGLRALSRGDLTAADTLLSRAVQVRGTDADAVGGLGLVRLREARHAEARGLFQRAAVLASDDRGKWVALARTAELWGTIAQGREAAAAGRAPDAERAARAALSMDAANPQAKLLLADALLAQRNWTTAEPLLRALLAQREPSIDAVNGMQTLLQATGRADEIDPLLDALQMRFRESGERAQLAQLRANRLASEAQQLADDGKIGPAAQRYETALRLAPDAPWTRFALARLYRDLGMAQLGRAVMDEGVAVSASPEMRYASALYRNSIDDVAGAQAVLAQIPLDVRTDGMRAFARRLDAQQELTAARRAFAGNAPEAAGEALERARELGSDDAYLTASVGALWIDWGQAERGLALMREWMSAHPQEADVDVRLRYGDLLGSAGRNDELDAWLRQLRDEADRMSEAQRARLEDEALRLALRETDTALEAHDVERAQRLLDQVSPAGRLDKRYALELADVERTAGRYAAARAALAVVLARTPDDPDAQLALARVLQESGSRAEALKLVRSVLAEVSPEDVDVRLSAARRLAALRQTSEAMEVMSPLRSAFPDRPDVTIQEGRLAEDLGRYEQAAALYRESLTQERASGDVRPLEGTPAQAALADLEQRRNPQVEAGWMPAYKSGDAGISQYRAQQVPVYVQMPYRYDGHFFLHLDVARLDAGSLAPTSPPSYALQTFGTYSAWASDMARPAAKVLDQHADGVGGGVGYVSDAWRFDLGSTPVGFPVHYLVGGVRYRFDVGPASFSISASRRPETTSVLSYAGLRDPWTNAVWGGVRRDGIDWHTSIDIGRGSFFSDFGAGTLTGVHVARNQAFTLRTGYMTPVYERANMQLSTGLVGNLWHYTDNLRYYSYGQGGYYSPQRYVSLGIPLEWSGRRGGLTWDLTTTVGISSAYEKDSPYFPNGLPSGMNAASAQTLSSLVYRGGSSGIGFSYGVSGVVQYRFNSRWVAGVRVDIDRSHDYAPSSAMIYLRYSLDARKEDNRLSPTPVRLYSNY